MATQTPDLAALIADVDSTITDAEITQVLCERVENSAPYTWASATVLVATNPYKDMSHLDRDAAEAATLYSPLTTAPPHPFTLAARVYHKMLHTQRPQSILYTGLTDSGKTYTMQRVIEHLLTLSASHSQSEARLADQVQCAQQLLSSFGSAKTLSNDQASRHATYWELHFSKQGRLAGAKILTFGLDKHRMHGLLPGERGYGIFYQLLAGASKKERTEYRLDEVTMNVVPTRDDARAFEWTRRALSTMGIKEKHVQGMLRVLAAILHIHAVDFVADGQGATISDSHALTRAADVLQVSAADLQQSLVTDTRCVGSERVTHMLDMAGAQRQRDALVQNLYAVLFAFLVEAMNQKLVPSDPHALLHIVQLDPPGFVSRSRVPNGPGRSAHYDDLMKNYLSDLVRHLHVRSILDASGMAGMMASEGLPILETHVPTDCMSLLRGDAVPVYGDVPPPGGMLGDYARAFSAVLAGERKEDDEKQLVHDLDLHKHHRAFISPHVDNKRVVFDINHAMGACAYTLRGHQRSEVDLLPTQQLQTLRASRSSFVARLWAGPGLAIESRLSDEQVVLRAQVSSRPLRRPTPLGDGVAWPETTVEGVSAQLDAVMIALVRTMQQADTCWYVCCLRAMDVAKPTVFDTRRVSSQVHAMGLSLLTNAQRYSYISMHLDEFQERYGALSLVTRARNWTSPQDYAVGQSVVCLSYPAWFSLQEQIGPIHASHAPMPEVHVSPASDTYQNDPMHGSTMMHSASAAMGPKFRQGPYLNDVPGSDMSLLPKGDDQDDPFLTEPMLREASHTSWPALMDKEAALLQPTDIEEVPITRLRRWWTWLTWLLTWWIPDSVLTHVLHQRRPDVRMAWREKVTICLLIFFFCAVVLFYIIGLGPILCPDYKHAWNEGQLGEHSTTKSFYVAVAGDVYDITKFYKLDHSDIPATPVTTDIMMQLAGQDLTPYFPVPLSVSCRGLVTDPALQLMQQENLTATIPQAIHKSGAAQPYNNTALNDQNWYYNRFLPRMKPYYKGYYVYDKKRVQTDGSWRSWATVNEKIYDLTNYVHTRKMQTGNNKYDFLNNNVVDLFEGQAGSDITDDFAAVMRGLAPDVRQETQACLDNAFYVGRLDFRLEAQCLVQNYLLLAFSCLIFVSIFAKFVSALQLAPRPMPEQQDRFVICHVPCYTEGEDSLRKTIESIAVQDYDDKRKLLFVVCDGMIVGSGNDASTPRIVLDIFGVDPSVDPEPLPFKSVAEGSKQLNYGKVYSGLFECEGHVVPYVVVVKVGRPSERSRPGNRGKRDTQILLMRYLNRVHFDTPMFPLELEIYHHMKNIIGIDPSFYEYVLMVDADTAVSRDGLNRLVSASVDDPRTIAVCGETLLENEDTSIWSMVQVYEYYISHNMAKAFESLFGSVTCLPGCFSMYRLRSPDRGRPLFISDKVIDDYSENRVDTLHKKNLLALGEDRYLTTLLLKHFPLFRTKFRSDAKAVTMAPESLSVLLSQRRRWINSTIHNLAELVMMDGLCGFCLFSMRFIVFIDLVGTIILPATAVYMLFLIITVATGSSPLPLIAIVMIAAVYGLQAIIFLLKRQWQYIGWMVIYLIAYPLYSFLLPIYSFWHMDDFSWGNTRVVVGEKGNKKVVAGTDDEPYSDAMIPRKTVTEYQQEIYANGDDSQDVLLYDMPPPPTSIGHGMYTPMEASDPFQDDYFQHTNLLDKQAKRASKRQSSATSWRDSWNGSASQPRISMMSGMPMLAPPSMYGMPPPPPPMYGMPPPPAMFPNYSDMGTPLPGATSLLDEPAPLSVPVIYAEDPTDEQIRSTIRAYLGAQPSLMQVTKRHVRQAVADAMPNADLTDKKDLMNQMIDDLLSGPS
ncbi:chitin synthase [Malassezia pachydermatis]|uniref:chitin synthase n=1 Tax=Malassezia pachydermatis TaxID=77020 RepID=A0A0M9VQD4_9BASI|nr:glycosyltransferase family 2 protein [Malassezia pachydermatis]KOS15373.1 glycosyltransferase family 2 protein [Malassezia pachydermatis]